MNKKVLVIHQGGALIVNTLTNLLKDAGIEVRLSAPEADRIRSAAEGVDLVIMVTGIYVLESMEIALYLKKLCQDENKQLCLLGSGDEIAMVKKTIPQELIRKEFVRPFNIRNVSGDILALFPSGEIQKEENKILLVDDDVMFLQTMQNWLRDSYKVSATKSGMQAITFLASNKPDLILLDYDMPVTSGPQVLEMIRSEPDTANIPVIFLTGRNDRESVMKVMSLKPNGYLLKSQSKENIIASVDRFFEKGEWGHS
ncbi:response regulator [[Clostridium] aminophilum]|uniref:response regulator n=1 Tax=[Clostridium] aminophilum TaxID=1526 RepID=UPI00332224F7